MENEYMKRGYLLPEGCKDLTDVAKLKQLQPPGVLTPNWPHKFTVHKPTAKAQKPAAALPPMSRQVFISPPMTPMKLAALLEQKPFRIICDLMQLGVWATVYSVIDFKACSLVARMHGFEAIKAG
jgi:hypothetical protein